MERIGIFGGTFDPPHLGHLVLAESARESLRLDQVLFMPAGHPPHKQDRTISPISHRLAMVRLAIADNANFCLDDTDITRPTPHHTATLLPLLAQAMPAARFWLLIGGDSLRDLPTWEDPHLLPRYCRLGVLPRPGATFDLDNLEQVIPGVAAAVDMIDGPAIPLSGTQIRAWVGMGRSLRYLMPASVRHYIHDHHLYTTA